MAKKSDNSNGKSSDDAPKKGKRKVKKKKNAILLILKWIFYATRFILTIPFYILKVFIAGLDSLKKGVDEVKVQKKRRQIEAKYEKFTVVEEVTGDYDEFEKDIFESESTIGIILGARGTGKSAIAIKMFENIYSKTKKKLYAMGLRREEMPSWIEVVDSVEKIKNDSIVLIDEGGILFSSRKSMSKPNKLLSDLMLIARHKNLSILFISQNSSNLEVNILRQADYLILKPSSLLQKNFERKIIKEIYIKTQEKFKKYKKDRGITYIHSDRFTGFVSNKLPSFWNMRISKSWDEK